MHTTAADAAVVVSSTCTPFMNTANMQALSTIAATAAGDDDDDDDECTTTEVSVIMKNSSEYRYCALCPAARAFVRNTREEYTNGDVIGLNEDI